MSPAFALSEGLLGLGAALQLRRPELVDLLPLPSLGAAPRTARRVLVEVGEKGKGQPAGYLFLGGLAFLCSLYLS